jgi:hypothetical protein
MPVHSVELHCQSDLRAASASINVKVIRRRPFYVILTDVLEELTASIIRVIALMSMSGVGAKGNPCIATIF